LSSHGRYLGVDRTGNSAIRSADPEKPILERKMKWIGRPIAKIWPIQIRNLEVHFGSPFWVEEEVVESHRLYHSKVSYRLSIVTIALSVIIRPQFAIECLQRSIQQGWVTLGQNFGVFPLE